MMFSFDITRVRLEATFDLQSPSSGVDPPKVL
jgi:hypothetical protein